MVRSNLAQVHTSLAQVHTTLVQVHTNLVPDLREIIHNYGVIGHDLSINPLTLFDQNNQANHRSV